MAICCPSLKSHTSAWGTAGKTAPRMLPILWLSEVSPSPPQPLIKGENTKMNRRSTTIKVIALLLFCIFTRIPPPFRIELRNFHAVLCTTGSASHPSVIEPPSLHFQHNFGQVLVAIVTLYRASAVPNMSSNIELDASEIVHLVEPQNRSFRANNPCTIFVQTDAQQVRLRSTRLNHPRLPTIDCV